MIFKVSNTCNLSCKECFMFNKGNVDYKYLPKIVPMSVVERIPEMILYESQLTGCNEFYFCFHGGEPLVVGKEYFSRIMDFLSSNLQDIEIKYSLQTNATLVDLDWIEIFEKYKIYVSASLNGYPESNKLSRVFPNGKDSTEMALNGIQILKQYENFGGLICVINSEMNGSEIVNYFIDKLNLNWFDLLLPDYTYDDIPKNWEYLQEKYLNVLIESFNAWYPFSDKVSCRIFDVTVGLLANYKSYVDSIGLSGVSSITIESNGELQPHDAIRICHGFNRKTGIFVGKNAISEYKKTDIYALAKNNKNEFSSKCRNCDEFQFCNGGNIIHRYSRSNLFNNPSVHCFVHYNFIKYIKKYLGDKILTTNTSNCCTTS